MLRIAICDDMPAFLQTAKEAVEQWQPGNIRVCVETFCDGDALIAAHSRNPFDIIFLDVVMPLLNGIEAAAELRKEDKTVKIVFLTSSPEYAVESYEVKADNYLLKPINKEKLYTCLDELYATILDTARTVVVRSGNGLHRVPIRDILYVESQGKIVVFTLKENVALATADPLYSFEDKLTAADGFFKCHRSYLVNFNQIRSYAAKELTMADGCRIPIARSSQKQFEAEYFAYLFGKAGDM